MKKIVIRIPEDVCVPHRVEIVIGNNVFPCYIHRTERDTAGFHLRLYYEADPVTKTPKKGKKCQRSKKSS